MSVNNPGPSGSSPGRSGSAPDPSGSSPGRFGATPASSGATPVRTEEPRKRPWWLLALLAVVAIGILLFALSRCGGSANPAPAPAPATPAAAPATGSPATAGAVDTSAPSAASGGGPGGVGSLTAAGTALLPLSGAADAAGSLAGQVGKPAVATGVKVLSVPADEGFWVGDSDTDRVWVQLTGGGGESPYTVKAGDRVDFTGPVVAHDAGFAAKVGVDAAEGADQLTREGAHIAIDKNAVKLSNS